MANKNNFTIDKYNENQLKKSELNFAVKPTDLEEYTSPQIRPIDSDVVSGLGAKKSAKIENLKEVAKATANSVEAGMSKEDKAKYDLQKLKAQADINNSMTDKEKKEAEAKETGVGVVWDVLDTLVRPMMAIEGAFTGIFAYQDDKFSKDLLTDPKNEVPILSAFLEALKHPEKAVGRAAEGFKKGLQGTEDEDGHKEITDAGVIAALIQGDTDIKDWGMPSKIAATIIPMFAFGYLDPVMRGFQVLADSKFAVSSAFRRLKGFRRGVPGVNAGDTTAYREVLDNISSNVFEANNMYNSAMFDEMMKASYDLGVTPADFFYTEKATGEVFVDQALITKTYKQVAKKYESSMTNFVNNNGAQLLKARESFLSFIDTAIRERKYDVLEDLDIVKLMAKQDETVARMFTLADENGISTIDKDAILDKFLKIWDQSKMEKATALAKGETIDQFSNIENKVYSAAISKVMSLNENGSAISAFEWIRDLENSDVVYFMEQSRILSMIPHMVKTGAFGDATPLFQAIMDLKSDSFNLFESLDKEKLKLISKINERSSELSSKFMTEVKHQLKRETATSIGRKIGIEDNVLSEVVSDQLRTVEKSIERFVKEGLPKGESINLAKVQMGDLVNRIGEEQFNKFFSELYDSWAELKKINPVNDVEKFLDENLIEKQISAVDEANRVLTTLDRVIIPALSDFKKKNPNFDLKTEKGTITTKIKNNFMPVVEEQIGKLREEQQALATNSSLPELNRVISRNSVNLDKHIEDINSVDPDIKIDKTKFENIINDSLSDIELIPNKMNATVKDITNKIVDNLGFEKYIANAPIGNPDERLLEKVEYESIKANAESKFAELDSMSDLYRNSKSDILEFEAEMDMLDEEEMGVLLTPSFLSNELYDHIVESVSANMSDVTSNKLGNSPATEIANNIVERLEYVDTIDKSSIKKVLDDILGEFDSEMNSLEVTIDEATNRINELSQEQTIDTTSNIPYTEWLEQELTSSNNSELLDTDTKLRNTITHNVDSILKKSINETVSFKLTQSELEQIEKDLFKVTGDKEESSQLVSALKERGSFDNGELQVINIGNAEIEKTNEIISDIKRRVNNFNMFGKVEENGVILSDTRYISSILKDMFGSQSGSKVTKDAKDGFKPILSKLEETFGNKKANKSIMNSLSDVLNELEAHPDLLTEFEKTTGTLITNLKNIENVFQNNSDLFEGFKGGSGLIKRFDDLINTGKILNEQDLEEFRKIKVGKLTKHEQRERVIKQDGIAQNALSFEEYSAKVRGALNLKILNNRIGIEDDPFKSFNYLLNNVEDNPLQKGSSRLNIEAVVANKFSAPLRETMKRFWKESVGINTKTTKEEIAKKLNSTIKNGKFSKAQKTEILGIFKKVMENPSMWDIPEQDIKNMLLQVSPELGKDSVKLNKVFKEIDMSSFMTEDLLYQMELKPLEEILKSDDKPNETLSNIIKALNKKDVRPKELYKNTAAGRELSEFNAGLPGNQLSYSHGRFYTSEGNKHNKIRENRNLISALESQIEKNELVYSAPQTLQAHLLHVINAADSQFSKTVVKQQKKLDGISNEMHKIVSNNSFFGDTPDIKNDLPIKSILTMNSDVRKNTIEEFQKIWDKDLSEYYKSEFEAFTLRHHTTPVDVMSPKQMENALNDKGVSRENILKNLQDIYSKDKDMKGQNKSLQQLLSSIIEAQELVANNVSKLVELSGIVNSSTTTSNSLLKLSQDLAGSLNELYAVQSTTDNLEKLAWARSRMLNKSSSKGKVNSMQAINASTLESLKRILDSDIEDRIARGIRIEIPDTSQNTKYSKSLKARVKNKNEINTLIEKKIKYISKLEAEKETNPKLVEKIAKVNSEISELRKSSQEASDIGNRFFETIRDGVNGASNPQDLIPMLQGLTKDLNLYQINPNSAMRNVVDMRTGRVGRYTPVSEWVDLRDVDVMSKINMDGESSDILNVVENIFKEAQQNIKKFEESVLPNGEFEHNTDTSNIKLLKERLSTFKPSKGLAEEIIEAKKTTNDFDPAVNSLLEQINLIKMANPTLEYSQLVEKFSDLIKTGGLMYSPEKLQFKLSENILQEIDMLTPNEKILQLVEENKELAKRAVIEYAQETGRVIPTTVYENEGLTKGSVGQLIRNKASTEKIDAADKAAFTLQEKKKMIVEAITNYNTSTFLDVNNIWESELSPLSKSILNAYAEEVKNVVSKTDIVKNDNFVRYGTQSAKAASAVQGEKIRSAVLDVIENKVAFDESDTISWLKGDSVPVISRGGASRNTPVGMAIEDANTYVKEVGTSSDRMTNLKDWLSRYENTLAKQTQGISKDEMAKFMEIQEKGISKGKQAIEDEVKFLLSKYKDTLAEVMPEELKVIEGLPANQALGILAGLDDIQKNANLLMRRIRDGRPISHARDRQVMLANGESSWTPQLLLESFGLKRELEAFKTRQMQALEKDNKIKQLEHAILRGNGTMDPFSNISSMKANVEEFQDIISNFNEVIENNKSQLKYLDGAVHNLELQAKVARLENVYSESGELRDVLKSLNDNVDKMKNLRGDISILEDRIIPYTAAGTNSKLLGTKGLAFATDLFDVNKSRQASKLSPNGVSSTDRLLTSVMIDDIVKNGNNKLFEQIARNYTSNKYLSKDEIDSMRETFTGFFKDMPPIVKDDLVYDSKDIMEAKKSIKTISDDKLPENKKLTTIFDTMVEYIRYEKGRELGVAKSELLEKNKEYNEVQETLNSILSKYNLDSTTGLDKTNAELFDKIMNIEESLKSLRARRKTHLNNIVDARHTIEGYQTDINELNDNIKLSERSRQTEEVKAKKQTAPGGNYQNRLSENMFKNLGRGSEFDAGTAFTKFLDEAGIYEIGKQDVNLRDKLAEFIRSDKNISLLKVLGDRLDSSYVRSLIKETGLYDKIISSAEMKSDEFNPFILGSTMGYSDSTAGSLLKEIHNSIKSGVDIKTNKKITNPDPRNYLPAVFDRASKATQAAFKIGTGNQDLVSDGVSTISQLLGGLFEKAKGDVIDKAFSSMVDPEKLDLLKKEYAIGSNQWSSQYMDDSKYIAHTAINKNVQHAALNRLAEATGLKNDANSAEELYNSLTGVKGPSTQYRRKITQQAKSKGKGIVARKFRGSFESVNNAKRYEMFNTMYGAGGVVDQFDPAYQFFSLDPFSSNQKLVKDISRSGAFARAVSHLFTSGAIVHPNQMPSDLTRHFAEVRVEQLQGVLNEFGNNDIVFSRLVGSVREKAAESINTGKSSIYDYLTDSEKDTSNAIGKSLSMMLEDVFKKAGDTINKDVSTVYIPKEVSNIIGLSDTAPAKEQVSKALSWFNKYLSWWKKITLFTPSFNFKNMGGNMAMEMIYSPGTVMHTGANGSAVLGAVDEAYKTVPRIESYIREKAALQFEKAKIKEAKGKQGFKTLNMNEVKLSDGRVVNISSNMDAAIRDELKVNKNKYRTMGVKGLRGVARKDLDPVDVYDIMVNTFHTLNIHPAIETNFMDNGLDIGKALTPEHAQSIMAGTAELEAVMKQDKQLGAFLNQATEKDLGATQNIFNELLEKNMAFSRDSTAVRKLGQDMIISDFLIDVFEFVSQNTNGKFDMPIEEIIAAFKDGSQWKTNGSRIFERDKDSSKVIGSIKEKLHKKEPQGKLKRQLNRGTFTEELDKLSQQQKDAWQHIESEILKARYGYGDKRTLIKDMYFDVSDTKSFNNSVLGTIFPFWGFMKQSITNSLKRWNNLNFKGDYWVFRQLDRLMQSQQIAANEFAQVSKEEEYIPIKTADGKIITIKWGNPTNTLSKYLLSDNTVANELVSSANPLIKFVVSEATDRTDLFFGGKYDSLREEVVETFSPSQIRNIKKSLSALQEDTTPETEEVDVRHGISMLTAMFPGLFKEENPLETKLAAYTSVMNMYQSSLKRLRTQQGYLLQMDQMFPTLPTYNPYYWDIYSPEINPFGAPAATDWNVGTPGRRKAKLKTPKYY